MGLTVIEVRFMEVVVHQLPSLIKEIRELNTNIKELKDEIRKRVRDEDNIL